MTKGMRAITAFAVLAMASPVYADCRIVMPGQPGGKPNTVIFEGCNIEVNNGTGSTAKINGLGNLTIGYNEKRTGGDDHRSGSHNLVAGSRNNFTSFGGVVVGFENETDGPYASVCGGSQGIASGHYSSVSGGRHNSATGDY
jgi:hypothetical protein